MAESLQLVWDLIARDNASSQFAKVGASAEEASAGVGKMLSGLSALAVGGVAVAAVKMAADFQASTTRLVTSANETKGNLEMVRQGLLDMAGQVGYGVEELSKAMYKVESGGQHGADGLMVLKAAAQGAKTENADLTTVADAVTSAMQDYHLKASDAADVTSKLVASTASGKMTFQELASSLHSVLPVASVAHISLNDILGDLASMTVHGISADQATQNMADAIRHLQSASQMSGKELALIGFTAQQVSQDLGTKGLSGTVQELSDAVLKQMGPGATEVFLHLSTALKGLDPQVRGLGQQLMEGTITQRDYMLRVKDLTPELAGQASQFATLAKATHSIGNEQMDGSTVMQSYAGAMKGLMGDATGMNVALMLTGENSKTTSDAIANVTNATADASGNVRGWDLIQGNFNQKLDQTKGRLQAMAIEAGTQLLPALSSVADFINNSALPGLEHLGHIVGDVVGWFSRLPGPVQEFAGALAGVKLLEMVGLFEKLSAGSGALGGAFRGFRADVQATAGVLDAAGVPLAGFAATLQTTAERGLGLMKSAAGGVVNMLGGPWGVGLAAAGGLAIGFKASLDEVTSAAQSLTDSLKNGGAGGQAFKDLERNQNRSILDAKSLGDAWHIASAAFADSASLWANDADAAAAASAKGKKAFDDWYNSLGLVDQKSQDVKVATANLNEVLKHNEDGSLAVREATDKVTTALQERKQASDLLSQSTKTSTQLAYENANAILAEARAGEGSKAAYDDFRSTLDQFRADQVSVTVSSAQLTAEQHRLSDSAFNSADAAGRAGTAWAKAAGIQDTSTASQYGQLLALQKVAQAMGVDTPASVRTSIQALQQSVAQGKLTADQMDGITRAVDGIPNNKGIAVTADTSQAYDALNNMLAAYQHVEYRGTSIVVNGRVIANASGNLLSPMSSSTAQVIRPGDLRVIGDNPTHPEAYIPINNSARSLSILGETAARMGLGLHAMANGGFVTSTDRFTAQPSGAMLDSAGRLAASFISSAPGAGSEVERWRGVVDRVLGILGVSQALDNGVLSLIQNESGGNPNAINLWDSNAMAGTPSQGLMQTIPSTFAAYAGPYAGRGITDPFASVYAGVNYALQNYGAAMLAGGGNHGAGGRYIGYKDGTNYVPETGLALLHKGESVRPATQQGTPYRERSGPVVHMENVHITDGTDVELHVRKAMFAESSYSGVF